MNDIDRRVMRCFEAVFPSLSQVQIRNAVRGETEPWDSLGSMLLAQTIEEEFGVPADLDLMDHLGSFDEVLAFVAARDQR